MAGRLILDDRMFDIAAAAPTICNVTPLPLADDWSIASARWPRRRVVRTIVAGEPRGFVANLGALTCGEHAETDP